MSRARFFSLPPPQWGGGWAFLLGIPLSSILSPFGCFELTGGEAVLNYHQGGGMLCPAVQSGPFHFVGNGQIGKIPIRAFPGTGRGGSFQNSQVRHYKSRLPVLDEV